MIVDGDYILEHFGVKGQKWGVRRNRSSGGKPSRKERRSQNRQAKQAFYEKKAEHIVKAAMKGDRTLIKINNQTVISGKEFIDHLSSGGRFDAKYTEVFAVRKGNQPFEVQPRVGQFKKNRS